MEAGEELGNLNGSFGEEDVHLLDGEEATQPQASLNIWWSHASNQEEVAMVALQEVIPPGVGLPEQEGVVNEVEEVGDMSSYFLRLNGGGDDLGYLNLDQRLFDNVPNDLIQDGNELRLLQGVYQPPSPWPPQEVVLEPHLFYGFVLDSAQVNLEIPTVESSSVEQAPLEEIVESVSQGLNLENLNLNPAVFLERLPPKDLEQIEAVDSSSLLESPPPSPLVESTLKNSPCLELDQMSNPHAPPPLIKRPEAVRHLPPPPPLVKRPEVEDQILPPPLPSSSLQCMDEASSRSRSTRRSERKKFNCHSAPPLTNEVKESSKQKKKRNPPKKRAKVSTTPAGWVEDDVWEYEKIMEAHQLQNVPNSPKHGKQNVYYVKWKGWSSNYNSWLRETDFVDPWPLEQFWKSTLEDINKRNRRIDKIPAATTARRNYFMS